MICVIAAFGALVRCFAVKENRRCRRSGHRAFCFLQWRQCNNAALPDAESIAMPSPSLGTGRRQASAARNEQVWTPQVIWCRQTALACQLPPGTGEYRSEMFARNRQRGNIANQFGSSKTMQVWRKPIARQQMQCRPQERNNGSAYQCENGANRHDRLSTFSLRPSTQGRPSGPDGDG